MNLSCEGFLEELASKAAAPGGGGASALVGAAGVALLLFWWAAVRQGGQVRRLLLLAVYLAAVFTALSIGMGGGPRYAYPVAMALLLLMVAVKLPAYVSTRKYYDPEWPAYAAELARLKAGEQDYIRVFPRWKNADWRIVMPRAPKAGAKP